MKYKSAIDSIMCILSSCDDEAQQDIVDHLTEHIPMSEGEEVQEHPMPTSDEMLRMLVNNFHKKGHVIPPKLWKYLN